MLKKKQAGVCGSERAGCGGCAQRRDLMDALNEASASEKKGCPEGEEAHTGSERELLPIQARKARKPAAAPVARQAARQKKKEG